MFSRIFLIFVIILLTKKLFAFKLIDLHAKTNDDQLNLMYPRPDFVNSFGFYDISTHNGYHNDVLYDVCIFID